MKFVVSREALIRPLQLVAGVVDRRQTMPILSNILIQVSTDKLILTGTDSEVELIARIDNINVDTQGETTVPAKKLLDICKSLDDQAQLTFEMDQSKVLLKSGRSRFTLLTLPADEFPTYKNHENSLHITIAQDALRTLIDMTGFAMAQHDVRYYLNGMLFELRNNQLRTVGTDGHRLATSVSDVDASTLDDSQIIMPRKGVLELARLLQGGHEQVTLLVGENHLRADVGEYTFTSKLVDARFPDYNRVIPRNGDKVILADRLELRQLLSRIAILSNEKFRGVHFYLKHDALEVVANNPEQEQADESMQVNYSGEDMTIGFNVNYLLDVLNALESDQIKVMLLDANTSALIQGANEPDSLFVVMPIRM